MATSPQDTLEDGPDPRDGGYDLLRSPAVRVAFIAEGLDGHCGTIECFSGTMEAGLSQSRAPPERGWPMACMADRKMLPRCIFGMALVPGMRCRFHVGHIRENCFRRS